MTSFRKLAVLLAIMIAAMPLAAEIKVGFSGMLDADVTTDFKGGHNGNQEFDLAMNLDFGSGVTVGFFATSYLGRVPAAGTDSLGARFDINNPGGIFVFDGITVTLKDKLGKGSTVEVMDLVYQYGSLDAYYFYKRLSLITKETFMRGASFAKDMGPMGFKVAAGLNAADDAIVGGNLKVSKANIIAAYDQGARTLNLGAVISDLPAGIKLIAGFISPMVDGSPEFGDAALNLAASFSIPLAGKLSLAGMVMFTKDDNGVNLGYFGVDYEELLVYLEPGIKISKYLAFGLPVEYHSWNDNSPLADDAQIWVVPTLYIYPVKGVEIWLWGQAVIHQESGADPDYYAGLETIVKF